MTGDYIDPRVNEALERAVALLVERASEWRNTIEAYWLIRRHEEELGFPLTYPMVEEAVERAKQLISRGKAMVPVEA